jgi:hypothetical protein
MTERDIFLALLDLPDTAHRSAFLAKACAGDAALRAQVESLLRSHDNAGGFLDRPALPPEQLGEGETQELGARSDADDRAPAGGNDLSFLAAPTRPDSLGRIGHYEVLEVLGRGGFGIVLRAFDEALQRVVAVKVLAPQLAATSAPRKRFLREARSSAKVRHENVVQVYAVEEQPLPYLVMEFIPGETLQHRSDRTGPLEVAEVLRIGRQIAEGLAAAHATGLIHRDVKPANVLIERGPHWHVKLTDFGLARAADDASSSQSGFIAGTPMYMAPEQANADPLDHRADLFSLGSVLYLMCSGRPPFRAPTTLAVLKRVAEDTPRPIREIIPEVPGWLCDIISRLHAKKPEDRFASAQEVADLLAQHLAQLQHPGGVQAPQVAAPAAGRMPPPQGSPAPAPALRPRLGAPRWAAAAAALLLLGGLGFTEATGVTDFRGTVIRLLSPEGTLVVEVDDPSVSVKIDGSELVITGAGAREIRLKPGSYTVEASKDGKVVRRELVAVTKNGRQVVRVSQEAVSPEAKAARAAADAAAWERSVAAMPAAEQVKAVLARLKELNPGFDGAFTHTIKDGVVTGLQFRTDEVVNIGPVRALKNLAYLDCGGPYPRKGKLSDLSPLKGMSLYYLSCGSTQVADLTALSGMQLTTFECWNTLVTDLAPLKGMPLVYLICHSTRVSDLSPLKGMRLLHLDLRQTSVSDLAPLKGMPLEQLRCDFTKVSNLSPLKGMRLRVLEVGGLPVSDLRPLQGMPLRWLNLAYMKGVTDLSPLQEMRLEWLNLADSGVSDLSPLKGMTSLKTLIAENCRVSDLAPLKGLELETIRLTPRNITKGLDILRDMRSLKTIGIGHEQTWQAADFWARYDKGEFKQ